MFEIHAQKGKLSIQGFLALSNCFVSHELCHTWDVLRNPVHICSQLCKLFFSIGSCAKTLFSTFCTCFASLHSTSSSSCCKSIVSQKKWAEARESVRTTSEPRHSQVMSFCNWFGRYNSLPCLYTIGSFARNLTLPCQVLWKGYAFFSFSCISPRAASSTYQIPFSKVGRYFLLTCASNDYLHPNDSDFLICREHSGMLVQLTIECQILCFSNTLLSDRIVY